MNRKMRSRGFTLIELLVVIAIIAILAAILFPVFMAAKRAANQSACASNLKQFAVAFSLYADDNGGVFVGQWYDDCYYDRSCTGDTHYRSWLYKVANYVRNRNGVAVCPASIGLNQSAMNYTTGNTSYMLPRFCCSQSVSQVRRPTHVIALWERGGASVSIGTYPNPSDSQAGNSWTVSLPFAWDIGPMPWTFSDVHNGGGNTLMMDGHVRMLKSSQMTNDMFWESWKTSFTRVK